MLTKLGEYRYALIYGDPRKILPHFEINNPLRKLNIFNRNIKYYSSNLSKEFINLQLRLT